MVPTCSAPRTVSSISQIYVCPRTPVHTALLLLGILCLFTMMRIPPSHALQPDQSISSVSRRQLLGIATTTATFTQLSPTLAWAEDSTMYAPEFVQDYPDFTKDPRGFSYRVVKEGSGEKAQTGDRVVYEWAGITIGYFGRPFQQKGGPQGGAFDKDLDYSRTVLGTHQVVLGLEMALEGMKPGGVRQVILPYGKLSYPPDDPRHDRVGPKPSTFSGQRALNFVLENPRVDRTLLFNVKVVRVDKPDTNGGFTRGA